MKLKERAKKIINDLPAVFYCLKDKDTPVLAKIFAAITVSYALSPVDLIPDFIPVLGYLDDIIILPLFIGITVKLIPKDVFEKNRELSKDVTFKSMMSKWYYAIPIVVIWGFIIYKIVVAIKN